MKNDWDHYVLLHNSYVWYHAAALAFISLLANYNSISWDIVEWVGLVHKCCPLSTGCCYRQYFWCLFIAIINPINHTPAWWILIESLAVNYLLVQTNTHTHDTQWLTGKIPDLRIEMMQLALKTFLQAKQLFINCTLRMALYITNLSMSLRYEGEETWPEMVETGTQVW